MKKRPHPDDIARVAAIARATSFSVVFVKSPAEKFNVTALTETDARRVARELNQAYGKFGRRACIYAIADGRAWPLPNQERLQKWQS